MNRLTCDILVIGSGMGGLSTAALLAHKGFSTIVIERLPRIGGRCSTLEYKGFKCITGVVGVEMGGAVEEVFRTVGAEFQVRPAGPPRYLIRDQVVEVPPKGGLKALLSAACDDEGQVERVLSAFSRAMGWMEPGDAISLRNWLLQYSTNEHLLDVFQTMVCATQMVNADELPAGEFFRFLKGLGGIKNFGFCPKGSITLPLALVKTIKDRGGEVWTSSTVKEIVVKNHHAQGAKVSRPNEEIEISANTVISNIGPKETMDLAGKENFDRGYRTQLEKDAFPAMLVCCQIASDEPLIAHNYLMVTGARRVNALYQPTLLCPELAPPGKHLLLAGAGPKSSLPPMDRERELSLCIEDLRNLIPDFNNRAKILMAGTFHASWPGMRCWPARDLPQKTPVVNLYNVGDGAKPRGTTGLPSTVASAMVVVEDVLNRSWSDFNQSRRRS